ncbi:MAG: hypothetical protein K0U98_05075 [Deltaproteobacteria bacterium]|nr:hypothetical protein [Deltaproteobacteria bacterium]
MKNTFKVTFSLALAAIFLAGLIALTTSPAEAGLVRVDPWCPAVACPTSTIGYTHTGFCQLFQAHGCPPLDCEKWSQNGTGQPCYRACAEI